MVPVDRILDTAAAEGCDIVGLSGLITPSLDEMVHVAKEMERRGMSLPLLIGGATTSRQHTAVKIAPEYHDAVVHVLDASRAVNVVAGMKDPRQRPELDRKNREDQARLRDLHKKKQNKPLLPLATARENGLRLEWKQDDLPRPDRIGRRFDADVPLAEIVPFIDWQF